MALAGRWAGLEPDPAAIVASSVCRIFVDTELWRIQGAYAIDCLDNFAALADSRAVLFERDGMVMLDLAVPR